MTYSQLRAFHYVALAGGFSRAAETLNQSQPSVSDQVRKLEEAYDVLLFRREKRQVHLTEAGRGLFRITHRFFEAEVDIRDFLSQNRAVPTGEIRIVVDSAVHITRAIGSFRDAYPNIKVSLWSGNTENVLSRLRNYEAEIGIVGNLGDAKDLDRIELGETPIIAIAAKGLIPEDTKEISFKELGEWRLVFREPGSRTQEKLESAASRLGVNLEPAIRVEGRESLREVVAAGAGIGFLSEAELGNDPRLCKFALSGVSLHMAETLVTLSARRDVAIIRAFLKHVT